MGLVGKNLAGGTKLVEDDSGVVVRTEKQVLSADVMQGTLASNSFCCALKSLFVQIPGTTQVDLASDTSFTSGGLLGPRLNTSLQC